MNAIVDACGDVKILATSREGLGISGERILAIAALDVPDGTNDVDVIEHGDAVRLFVRRDPGGVR